MNHRTVGSTDDKTVVAVVGDLRNLLAEVVALGLLLAGSPGDTIIAILGGVAHHALE